LGLLLGAYKENFATGGDGFDHIVVGAVEAVNRLLQVEDVDTVAGPKDIRLHFGVPTAGLVTEVGTGFEQGAQ
jgi:hypothetical protein